MWKMEIQMEYKDQSGHTVKETHIHYVNVVLLIKARID